MSIDTLQDQIIPDQHRGRVMYLRYRTGWSVLSTYTCVDLDHCWRHMHDERLKATASERTELHHAAMLFGGIEPMEDRHRDAVAKLVAKPVGEGSTQPPDEECPSRETIVASILHQATPVPRRIELAFDIADFDRWDAVCAGDGYDEVMLGKWASWWVAGWPKKLQLSHRPTPKDQALFLIATGKVMPHEEGVFGLRIAAAEPEWADEGLLSADSTASFRLDGQPHTFPLGTHVCAALQARLGNVRAIAAAREERVPTGRRVMAR